jgi:hypothetical protein
MGLRIEGRQANLLGHVIEPSYITAILADIPRGLSAFDTRLRIRRGVHFETCLRIELKDRVAAILTTWVVVVDWLVVESLGGVGVCKGGVGWHGEILLNQISMRGIQFDSSLHGTMELLLSLTGFGVVTVLVGAIHNRTNNEGDTPRCHISGFVL